MRGVDLASTAPPFTADELRALILELECSDEPELTVRGECDRCECWVPVAVRSMQPERARQFYRLAKQLLATMEESNAEVQRR